MAHKAISEADGKRMLARLFKDYSDGKYEISDKIFTVGPNTDMTKLPIRHQWLTTEKLVVKPDQLIKRRGKNNLVLVGANFNQAKEWIKEAELVFTSSTGKELWRGTIQDFKSPGIIQGIHNTDKSISSFAKACFTYAYDMKLHLWFGAKDTISKTYDAQFRKIFEEEYQKNWKIKFEESGLKYFFTLIDDAVARIMKTEGGMLWACKNYDGDVMSDMLGSAYGSLAMMTSVLVSPQGYYEFEASHGTVQKHYYKYLRGEKTSSNSMALIFAWSGCLKKRGELDQTPKVVEFAKKLEEAALETVEDGIMTGDLMVVATPNPKNKNVSTEEFIAEVSEKLKKKFN